MSLNRCRCLSYTYQVKADLLSYFFTLVGMQWGNLLATRTRRLSIFQHNPFSSTSGARNWWIPPAMLASLAFLFFFSYVPFFQNTFLTRVSLSSSQMGVGLMNRVFRSNISSCHSRMRLVSSFLMKEGSMWSGSTPRVSSLGLHGNAATPAFSLVRWCL
jgi:hypothetical protein